MPLPIRRAKRNVGSGATGGLPPSFVARCERADPPPRGNRCGGWRHGEDGEGPAGGRPGGSAEETPLGRRAPPGPVRGSGALAGAVRGGPAGPPLLLLLVLRLEAGDHGRIGEGGGVAEGAPLGDVAEEPAHDLAAARLREVGGKDDVIGAGEGADLLHHVRLQFVAELEARGHPLLDRHEGGEGLAFDLVTPADDGRLRDERVVDERRLDLHRRDAVPRHVDDVIDAAEEPEVPVLVELGAVAGEVDVLVAAPVLLHVPLWIAPNPPEHAGPWLAPDGVAGLGGLAVIVEHGGVDARERLRRRARLAYRDTGQRREDRKSAGEERSDR